MNPTEHIELIQQLAAVHQPFGWSDNSVDGYLLGLADLPVDLLRQVVVTSIQTADGMPTPANLRRAALDLVAPLRPPSVEAAWQEVMDQIARVGRVGTPRWSHPLVGEAQKRTGTWIALCNTEERDMKDTKWSFRNSYKDLVERAELAAMKSPGLRDTAALLGIKAPAPPPMIELDAVTDGGNL